MLRVAVALASFSLLALFNARPVDADELWPDPGAHPAVQGGGEHDAALVVAIENYLTVPKIPGAVANGEGWYRYFVDARRVPVERVTLLRNTEGTVEKMRRFAAQAASAADAGGTVWFVFIGHGAPSRDGHEGTLVGFDAQQDADSLFARSLGQKELLAILQKGRQAKTVALVDACFNGRSSTGAPLVPGLQPLIPVSHEAAEAKDVVLLTAGATDQFAGPLPGAARPAFSYLALGGLEGWADANGDGAVTGTEVVAYARRAMQTLVHDRSQTPEVTGDRANDALVSGARATGPNLSEIALNCGGAPPQSVAPVTPTSANPAPATVVGRRLKISAENLHMRFDVSFDGGSRRATCPEAVDAKTPCVVGIPTEKGTITAREREGILLERRIDVPDDDVNVRIVRRGYWPVFVGGALLAAGVVIFAMSTAERGTLATEMQAGGAAAGTLGLASTVYGLARSQYAITDERP